MSKLHTIEAIHAFIKDNRLAFLYVSQQNCSVCHAILPKLKRLLEAYPEIAFGEVAGEEVQQISSDYAVFSAPTLLLFIQGKEYIREGRFVQFEKLAFELERLYSFEMTMESE